jgi:hypothetical protein
MADISGCGLASHSLAAARIAREFPQHTGRFKEIVLPTPVDASSHKIFAGF